MVKTVLHGIDLGAALRFRQPFPSGSGKTTLLRCINLPEQPEAGTIKST